MPSPEGRISFSLDKADERVFILYNDCIDRLQPDFVEWLERFVGKFTEATAWSATGRGWHYEEKHSLGQESLLSLRFDDPRHAAMFKLIWGYDCV